GIIGRIEVGDVAGDGGAGDEGAALGRRGKERHGSRRGGGEGAQITGEHVTREGIGTLGGTAGKDGKAGWQRLGQDHVGSRNRAEVGDRGDVGDNAVREEGGGRTGET